MANTDKDTLQKYKNQFFKFMKKNNILPDYLKNLENGIFEEKDFSKFQEKYFITDYIDTAFVWAETAQGYDFWYKINRKWNNSIRKRQNSVRSENKSQFFEFLRARGILSVYLKNFKKDLWKADFGGFQKKYFKENYINAAFDWGKTDQGSIFWSEINELWRVELLRGKLKNKNQPKYIFNSTKGENNV